jgi:DNA-binding LacI/PurR family transcriptional regulator
MSQLTPLYKTIMNYYLNEITTSKLLPGERMPTEQEISEKFKVSRVTAIRALKELDLLGFVYRKQGSGTYIHDRSKWRNSKDSLENQPNKTSLSVISVILPNDAHIQYDILKGVEKKAKEYGYYVTVHSSSSNPLIERELIQQLKEDHVSGIIVYPISSISNIETYGNILKANHPFILIDKNIEVLDIPYVASNNLKGIYDIVSYLIELGHKEVAFVYNQTWKSNSITERLKGYCQAIIDGNIQLSEEKIIDISQFYQTNETGRIGYKKAIKLVLSKLMSRANPPTAIVAYNDGLAIDIMKEAQLEGIKIPEDISITGFDNLSICEHLEVPLTTVEQNFLAMGEQAADLLFQYIDSGKKPTHPVILDVNLMIRQSTAPPKGQTSM